MENDAGLFDEITDKWNRGDAFVWHVLILAQTGDQEALDALELWWTGAPFKEPPAEQRII
jgi:hypothetical protein